MTRQERRLIAKINKKLADRQPTGQHLVRTLKQGGQVQELPPGSPIPNRAGRRSQARLQQAQRAAPARWVHEKRATIWLAGLVSA
jgi:hypothetical protein